MSSSVRPGIVFARLAALVAAATIVGACVEGAGAAATAVPSGAPTSPAAPGIELPSVGDTLLVQVRTEGGFVAPSFRFGALPQVSIYADGRLIEQGAVAEIYPGPLLPSLSVRRLTASQLRDVLSAAEAAGLSPDAETTSFPPHGIADAPDTVIDVWTPAGLRTTSFGAFGMDQTGMDATETAARAAAAAFIDGLQALSASNEAPYVPTAARVIVRPYADPDPAVVSESVDWPLATPLAAASPLIEGSPAEGGCLVVTGSDLASVWPLFEKANAATSWRSGGDRYALVVRPLLPSEAPTCG